MTHTSRALTIVGTVADVRPLASRLVAALVALRSAEGEAEDGRTPLPKPCSR